MLNSIISGLQDRDEYSFIDLLMIHLLTFCPNDEIRYDAAELLCSDPSLWKELTLLRMTFDPNEMVRLNAIDSLSIGRTKLACRRLIKISHSQDELIRGYCLMSLIDILNNRNNKKEKGIYFRYIIKRLNKEKSDKVRLMVNSSLFTSGIKSRMTDLVKVIEKQIDTGLKDYWLIMNVIDDICEKNNRNELKQLVRKIHSKISDESRINRWKETEARLIN